MGPRGVTGHGKASDRPLTQVRDGSQEDTTSQLRPKVEGTGREGNLGWGVAEWDEGVEQEVQERVMENLGVFLPSSKGFSPPVVEQVHGNGDVTILYIEFHS